MPNTNTPPAPTLDLYAIYHDTADFPGKYAVRRWFVTGEGRMGCDVAPIAVVGSLDEARGAIITAKPGAHPIKRNPTDDPVLVETWL